MSQRLDVISIMEGITMAKTTHGLGKGFDSLLPQNFDDTLLLGASDRVEKIPVGKLTANRYQPRQEFDEAAIGELAASIKHYGILQPLAVTRPENGGYRVSAGARPSPAAKQAGI